MPVNFICMDCDFCYLVNSEASSSNNLQAETTNIWMEEDHGEKAEFGETGHFRAGVVDGGPVLGRTFGNADECG